MYRRLGDHEGSGPSPDGSVLLGFLLVVAVSIGAFVWTGDTRDRDAGVTVRVYQHPAALAEISANSPAVDLVTTSAATAATGDDATSPASAPVSARCNIDTCAAAYRSFRVADCTFQPYEGPRRLCTRR